MFCVDRTVSKNIPEEYKVDIDIFDIYFDLASKQFLHAKDKKDKGRYFDLKSLFDGALYAKALVNANVKDQQIIQDLHTQFTNYEIPVITTKKRDLGDVGMIFVRVNNTGTGLDLFDLMVALTWTKRFHLQDEFKALHATLEKKNFERINNKILLQCLSSMIKESSRLRVILSLDAKVIRNKIGPLNKALEKAVDYLSTELLVKSSQLLPHRHQIVPLCYFFSRVNTPTLAQKREINKWFWKTSFSERYRSSTDMRVDEDVASFKKLAKGGKNVFAKLDHDVSPEQLRETKFLKSNPYSRAFVVLLANKHPKNLVNGANVDTGNALSHFNRSEYHHIFPKAFLLDRKIESAKISSLCNFCILPSDSNKKISDKSPSNYFFKVIPQVDYKKILESNLLPTGKSVYKKNDYDKFLIERSKAIFEYLESRLK